MRGARAIFRVAASALVALVCLTTASAASFRHGLNVSHWLQYDGRQPVGPGDMQMIAAAGFDHIRLPFDPVKRRSDNPPVR